MIEKIRALLTRWPIILGAGFIHGFVSPPFNGELHWLLTPLPFIVSLCILPFLYVAVQLRGRDRVLRLLAWGAFHNFGTLWWLSKVSIEGLWPLLILSVFVLAVIQGVWYLASGLLMGWLSARFTKLLWLILPAVWVVVDYSKVLGEIAFPWMFEGYYYAALPRFSQVASLGGVWLLTFFALFFVTGILLTILARPSGKKVLYVAGAFFLLGCLYGEYRLQYTTRLGSTTVAVLQPHFDQATWDDDRSLGEQLAINDSLMALAGEVDLLVLPESGMYCYYRGSFESQIAVREAREKYPTTNILCGTLDFRRYRRDSIDVFNGMLFIPQGETVALMYHKEKLVPFAETVPLKGIVPLLSRLEKWGVSNFVAGKEKTVWQLPNSVAIAPTICYEGIFPQVVRERKRAGAEVIINGTNDGWFGLSQGPFQHALMTRLRAIECAIPVIRSANSGISYVVDSRGRYIVKSKLLSREVLRTSVPVVDPRPTLYLLWGDWVVLMSSFIVLGGLVLSVVNKKGDQLTA